MLRCQAVGERNDNYGEFVGEVVAVFVVHAGCASEESASVDVDVEGMKVRRLVR